MGIHKHINCVTLNLSEINLQFHNSLKPLLYILSIFAVFLCLYRPFTGSKDSRRLSPPDFMTMTHEGGKVVSPTHWQLLLLSKYSWYSFLLAAESNFLRSEGLLG